MHNLWNWSLFYITKCIRAFRVTFSIKRFMLYYRWTLTFTISGIVSIQLINCRIDVWKFMYKYNDFINTRVVCWVAKFMSQSHSCASSAHGQFYNSQIFRKSGISRHTGFASGDIAEDVNEVKCIWYHLIISACNCLNICRTNRV
jgi:hypothetical protein